MEKTLMAKLGRSSEAPPELHWLSEKSWVILQQGYLSSTPAAFDREWNHPLKPHTKRKLRVFGRDCFENRWSLSWGADYPYSGQKAEAAKIETGSFVAELEASLNAFAPVNGCLENWYEADSTIGAHADDEGALVKGEPIFALSWGATRRFRIVPKKKDTNDKSMEFYLSDGDLLVMGGDLQQTHKHDIPTYRKTKDPFPPGRRISWTFRVFRPEYLLKKDEPPSKRRRTDMKQVSPYFAVADNTATSSERT